MSQAFSDAYFTGHWAYAPGNYDSPSAACSAYISGKNAEMSSQGYSSSFVSRGTAAKGSDFICKVSSCNPNNGDGADACGPTIERFTIESHDCSGSEYCNALSTNADLLPVQTDEECSSSNGDTINVSASSANYLNSGGSVKTHGGACSVTSAGGVAVCSGTDGNVECALPIESSSTNEYGEFNPDSSLNGGWGEGNGTFSVVNFNTPEYLNPLPGGCSDSSSCVTIGDTSYLVDWDSAPDYFSYVDSNGTTHSNPSSGGGSGGDTGGGDNGGGDPTDPTDPTDPGGDNGGGDDSGNDDSDDNNGGGGSGGGSTVLDFEFDESGIIEAIGSAGQSNRNAINALSNDVTSAINDQTNDLNNATSAQTDALNSTLNNQTDSLTSSLDDQTNDLTTAIDDQTGTLSGSLDALGTSIVDAINGLGADDGEGDGEDEGDKEGFFEGLVDSLADRFDSKIDGALNPDGMPGDSETAGMIDGEGAADSVMESLEQGADRKNTAIYDEFEGFFEGGGVIDGTLAPLRDFVTSFLPNLPTGGCTPLTFGAGERSFTIDCEGFNLLKAALSWVLFFFTAYQLISIPMDARKSQ